MQIPQKSTLPLSRVMFCNTLGCNSKRIPWSEALNVSGANVDPIFKDNFVEEQLLDSEDNEDLSDESFGEGLEEEDEESEEEASTALRHLVRSRHCTVLKVPCSCS